jgi:hypothetical protein
MLDSGDGYSGLKSFLRVSFLQMDEKSHVKEIPRPQRQLRRPSLEKIFKVQKTKTQRNENIYHAHVVHGYLLKEITDYLKIHYTTASKAIVRGTEGRK